jgi:hypothetical protein
MAPGYILSTVYRIGEDRIIQFLCRLWGILELSGPDTAVYLELGLGLIILSLMLFE